MRRPKLTYANVTATVALFASITGGAYASGLIDGHLLRNGSVTAKKLKAHTLTGKQINLARLGTVPSAAHARTAHSATTAQRAEDARTLGGRPAAAFLPAGGTAADSSKLGGQPASAFLPAGGTAADSSKLGGQPASAYVLGSGFAESPGTAIEPLAFLQVDGGTSRSMSLGPTGRLEISCSDPATGGSIDYRFATGRSGTVYSDDGHGNIAATTSAASSPIAFGSTGHISYLVGSGSVQQQISVWLAAGLIGTNQCFASGFAVTNSF